MVLQHKNFIQKHYVQVPYAVNANMDLICLSYSLQPFRGPLKPTTPEGCDWLSLRQRQQKPGPSKIKKKRGQRVNKA